MFESTIENLEKIGKTDARAGYDLTRQGEWFILPNRIKVFIPDERLGGMPDPTRWKPETIREVNEALAKLFLAL